MDPSVTGALEASGTRAHSNIEPSAELALPSRLELFDLYSRDHHRTSSIPRLPPNYVPDTYLRPVFRGRQIPQNLKEQGKKRSDKAFTSLPVTRAASRSRIFFFLSLPFGRELAPSARALHPAPQYPKYRPDPSPAATMQPAANCARCCYKCNVLLYPRPQ